VTRTISLAGAIAVALLLAACSGTQSPVGSILPATPTEAKVFLLPNTSTPTTVPSPTDVPVPTATALPPTATPVPATATPMPATPTPASPTAVPATSIPPTPVPPTLAPLVAGKGPSWLDNATVLGFYGRGFGIAPILGRLGGYQTFDDMAKDVDSWSAQVKAVNGGKPIVPELHLIYGLAVPCAASDDCLLYLEGSDSDLVSHYIKPAAARGWLIFLDTQMGKSDPVTQVQRMIDKGYLQYDNVEVALDPEFHVYPGHDLPGIPVGTIEASQLNDAQALLDNYVQSTHLAHRKILVIHQFGDKNVNDGVPYMIGHKETVKAYPSVDLVITADGLGSADAKISKYNLMTDTKVYPFIRWRGLKIFPPNPFEHNGHTDQPLLTFRQIYGLDPTVGKRTIDAPPNLIIIN
jgi:hypothetical protein